MSLLRLLTTGKSLEGVGESVNRYRLTHQRLLPRFGGAGNPFRGPAPAGGAEATADAAPAPAVAAPVQEAPREAAAAAEKSAPRPGWFARLAGRWTRNRPSARPAAATVFKASGPGPVQGELLLDQVKPVRNDLSDSDLEVVAVKRKVPAARATPKSGADAPEPAEKGCAEKATLV